MAAAAWVVLAWGGLDWYPFGGSSMAGHHHQSMTPAGGGPGLASASASHLLLWMAMVGATMLPLIAENLRGVGLRSPLERRTRASLEVAAGWALVWLAAGVVIAVGLAASPALVPPALVPPVTVGVVGAVAVGWQFTRIKRVALARCHRRFAPPLGPPAGRACLRFGRSLGRDCLLSCWPSMAMMSVAGHHLLAVVALGWLSWRDRRRPSDRPGLGIAVAVLVGVGAFTLLRQV